jgi:hypothetical protein
MDFFLRDLCFHFSEPWGSEERHLGKYGLHQLVRKTDRNNQKLYVSKVFIQFLKCMQ